MSDSLSRVVLYLERQNHVFYDHVAFGPDPTELNLGLRVFTTDPLRGREEES